MLGYATAFARLYDPLLARGERAGMAQLRRSVLAAARGEVVELGAGTGLNLPAYRWEGIDRLVLTEPDAAMANRLRRRASHGAVVVEAPANRLPLPDASVDAVVSTLVLCTVDDVPGTLAEVRRVLRPGGRLLLIEHVRAEDERLLRWQERLRRPWQAVGRGCRCDRDTAAALARSGFDTAGLHPASWTAMPAIVRSLVAGAATPV